MTATIEKTGSATEPTKGIIRLSSGAKGGSCASYGTGFGDSAYFPPVERQVNHRLGHAECTPLHAGQVTGIDRDSKPYQSTVVALAIPETTRPPNYHTGD